MTDIRELLDVAVPTLAGCLVAADLWRITAPVRAQVDRTSGVIDQRFVDAWIVQLRRARVRAVGVAGAMVLVLGVGREGFLPGGVVLLGILGVIAWAVHVAPIGPEAEGIYVRMALGARVRVTPDDPM